MASGDAEGSSISLNITATAVKQFMNDTAKRPKGMKLRDWVYFLLGAFGERWYKRGVRRGHMESYKEFKATCRLSEKLSYEEEKELFTNQVRQVSVVSKIKSR